MAQIKKPSEESLDVYIPSFPGSPRSINMSEVSSYESPVEGVLEAEQIDIDTIVNIEIGKFIPDEHLFQEDTNILAASEIGNIAAIVTIIKQNGDIHRTDHLGRNALHLAVQTGHLEIIEMLLKAGIDPRIKDRLGMTPLLLCLMRNPSLEVVQLLFQYGTIILPRSSPMDTGIFLQFVMMCTPTTEDIEIMHLLIEKGALVDDPKAPGQRQALHFAAMSNNCILIKVLITLGANLHAVNHRNETPRQVAQIFECKDAAHLLASLENASTVSRMINEVEDIRPKPRPTKLNTGIKFS